MDEQKLGAETTPAPRWFSNESDDSTVPPHHGDVTAVPVTVVAAMMTAEAAT